MAAAAQLAAYFYPATRAQKATGKLGKYELHALDNGQREIRHTTDAADMRAARKLAAADGATPWNF